jgi:hypothetical protein
VLNELSVTKSITEIEIGLAAYTIVGWHDAVKIDTYTSDLGWEWVW